MKERKKIIILSGNSDFIGRIKGLLDKDNYSPIQLQLSENTIFDIEKIKPDLIIIDILYSGPKAIFFLDKLRENTSTQNFKIIAVSENKRIENIVGPTPKVKGYISKPVDFEELKRLINSFNFNPNAKIMLVDDDEEFSDLLKMFFESNNFSVVIEKNPLKAVERVKTERPELLLLDIMMPQKDGFEIIEELQDDSLTASVPIIVLTGLKFDTFQEKGIITGIPEIISRDIPDDFLKKIIEQQFPDSQVQIEIRKQQSLPKVLIADDQTELLLLVKETIEKAGFEVYIASDGKEAIDKVYEVNPDIIVLDYNMPIKDGLSVAQELKDNPLFAHIPIIIVTAYGEKQAKLKGLSMGIDDYLIKPVDTDELIARIRMILKRNKQVLDTNPLSKLPGNPSIQARIERVLQSGKKFAVLYIDLNNFKAYNDIYGFEAGDRVIKTTANILVKTVLPGENSENFIGHIGGDDFIVITDFEDAEPLAKKIINAFNEISPSFYNKEDREKGYIIATDRQGNIKKFSLLSISIGIVHNNLRQITSYAQISNIGSELKKAAKNSNTSAYVIDKRRG